LKKRFLLSINIPTFGRNVILQNLLIRVFESIEKLDPKLHEKVIVQVFDNHSPEAISTEPFRSLMDGLSVEFRYLRRSRNLGGDENLSLAAEAGKIAEFVWVLGDDDLPSTWSVSYILYRILTEENLGLIYLIGEPAGWENLTEFPRAFASYLELIKFFAAFPVFHPGERGINPVLGQTLVSANVYRSDLYSREMYEFVKNVLNPCLGVGVNFAHMYAIVKSLIDQPSFAVELSPIRAIEAYKLDSSKDVVQIRDINTLYAAYMNFIRYHGGVGGYKWRA